ncbi:MAG: GSCFA domain-containing protein [Chitinophagaceae bacterium]
MSFLVPFTVPSLSPKMRHSDKVYLVGSCFTEHIYGFLKKSKFDVRLNAHGIVFNPYSIVQSLEAVMSKKVYTKEDLFFLDEYWHSWQHHSDFSDTQLEEALGLMNKQIEDHHYFLKQAQYIFITLGSAFAYFQKDKEIYVSNNHRAPANWFRKDLLEIDTIKQKLNSLQQKLQEFAPGIQILYTISPVRHIRDGIIENNRSKARLIEAVHSMPNSFYFPSYELVIDVLRDYRFFDLDLAHPNYQATQYVWEQFKQSCIDDNAFALMLQCDQLYKAMHHKSKNTSTQKHQQFLKDHIALCHALISKFPYLKLEEELAYFQNQLL